VPHVDVYRFHVVRVVKRIRRDAVLSVALGAAAVAASGYAIFRTVLELGTALALYLKGLVTDAPNHIEGNTEKKSRAVDRPLSTLRTIR
jgi:hypothetical protein